MVLSRKGMLVIFLILLLIGAGIVGAENQSYRSNRTNLKNISELSLPVLSQAQMDLVNKRIEEQIRQHEIRKGNLTKIQGRLDSPLLTLVDSKPPSRMTPQQLSNVSDSGIQIIPFSEVESKLGITPRSDLVLVRVSINQSLSPDRVKPFFTSISGIYKNEITGWVEISDIEKIASLDDVNQISSVSHLFFSTHPIWVGA